MGAHIARMTIQQMIAAGRSIKGACVNVLGLSFKENCADIRNSKVVDVVRELAEFGVAAFVHDPHADPKAAWHEYGIELTPWDSLQPADALILAVSHASFVGLPPSAYLEKILPDGCLIDIKSALDPVPFRKQGVTVWRL